MRPLDVKMLPLEGTVCIEASAGTGKTFTIGLIVLRLVMERELDLDKLAVVTYTEAATAELVDRITRFARVALMAAEGSGTEARDEEIANLVDAAIARCEETAPGRGKETVLRRLDRALMTIDMARISTIHGFCQRILTEFTFETGSSFGVEIITNQQSLIGEILADFWRINIAGMDIRTFNLLKEQTPDALRSRLKKMLVFPGLKVVPGPVSMKDAPGYFRAFDFLRKQWEESRDALRATLSAPGRFKQTSFRLDRIEGYIEKIDLCFDSAVINPDALGKLSKSKLEANISKDSGYRLPKISFCSAVEPFIEKYEGFAKGLNAAVTAEAYQYLTGELRRRKQERRLRSFDNMIVDLAEGLERGGELTASQIRKRFTAVLVDEFQDTDALQYQIFQQLFASQKEIFFAVIGDPKQAIYRFRGGDIATYVRARNNVPPENQYTLANNYRSEPRLVDAINKLYKIDNPLFDGNGPFLTKEIGYIPVTAKQDLRSPEQSGAKLPPIILWNAPDGERPDETIIGRRIVDAIAGFMDPSTPLMIGSAGKRRPLRLGDIAILVNSHHTAWHFKTMLAGSGMLAVVGRSGLILESDEADELQLLLAAMLNPSREPIVRALLVSELYGYDLDALTAWEQNERERLATLEELAKSQLRWSQEGVAVAINHLLGQRGLFAVSNDPATDLLNERRITNYRHLIEILHAEELRIGRIPERLFTAYVRMKADAVNSEMEQRLESDSDSVQIVTMHKAKGLQWPLVFAPDLWRRGIMPQAAGAPILFDKTSQQRVADLRPQKSEENKELENEEIRQERMRLAYVTLTRAESLLIVVTANAPERGADIARDPAALLLRSANLKTMTDDAGPLVQSEALSRAEAPRKYNPAVQLNKQKNLSLWPLGRALAARWSVGSYSGLTRGIAQNVVTKEVDPTPAEGIFAFPKGAAAGTALHSVFERLDFLAAGRLGESVSKEFLQRIEGILTDAGFPTKKQPQWVGNVVEMVKNVIQAPIPEVATGFRLGDLSGEDRVTELEFHLTAAHPDLGKSRVTSKELESAVGPVVGRISADAQLAGYLNGFIDLIFRRDGKWWILDWKSNHLGNSPGLYNREALRQAMEDHNYYLQYHLYTVALTRYLKAATGGNFDYEQDFGGVLYMFLRGVDGNGNGIFHERPDREVIQRLERLF
jgi:exodeoxyribonuclease V beta subunit